MTKNCLNCGKVFTTCKAQYKDRKTCSYFCRQKYLFSLPEYKNHMRLIHKGQIGHMLGKNHSIESKKKIGLASLGNKNMLGYKFSEKSKIKMSESHKGQKAWNKNKQLSEEHKKNMFQARSNQKKINTLPERLFEQELINNNINYEKQVLLVNKTITDFYLPETKTAIYVDGDYWHTKDKKIMIRDYGINKYLTKCGYNVFRFWEFEIKNVDIRKQLISCLI